MPSSLHDPSAPPTREQAMAAVPVPHEQVETVVTEAGATRLVFPLAHRPWVKRLAAFTRTALPSAGTKALELDELGAWTWRLIDGQRTVADICAEFAASWRLHPREAELAVTAFLRELGKRGLVLLRMQKVDGPRTREK